MKLGPVIKLDRKNKTNYDVIVTFPIYDQLEAIQKLNSGLLVCKTYIFINSNLISYKN